MKFYYFNSTHWDREWYQSFQEFRKYLCDTTGEILRLLREDKMEKFIFDGQSIVLKDICELYPSRRPAIEEMVRSGRLIAGPWYVMPDEFLVSPEALIRNLLAGRATVREFGGEPWPIGYVCDIFGHIAQLPQIFAGFALEGVVAWRGFPPDSGVKVVWQGSDGTALPVLRLWPRNGYGNFTLKVRGWWDIPLDKEEFIRRFQTWVEETKIHFGETFVLSDTVDHCQAHAQTKEMLNWIQELYPDAEVIHSDYRDFFAGEFTAEAEAVRVEGEQIAPADTKNNGGWQIGATLSSRYDVKLANDRAQSMLELLVEPQLAVRAAAAELPSTEALDYLWKHLLQNQAHDSICGCSIDSVHRAVLCRLDEVMALGRCMNEEFMLLDKERLTGVGIHHTMRRFEGDEAPVWANEAAADGAYTLRIYNPLPFRVAAVRELELAFPAAGKYPEVQAEPFGYEELNGFKIYDSQGEVPYSIKKITRNQTRLYHRCDVRSYHLYQVVLPLELAAASWETLRIEPCREVVRYWDSLLCGHQSADNGILHLQIHNDGTFTVTDKRSGRTYPGQNSYWLDREIGDGWNHVSPVGAPALSGGGSALVQVAHNGCGRVEFAVTRTFELPRELCFEGGLTEKYTGITESETKAKLHIRTNIALERGSDMVRITTVIDNPLKDFRLRVAVPTGIEGKYFVSQSGTFLERTPGREHGEWSRNFVEPERIGKNFDGIIGRGNAAGGVALLSCGGLHEGGALVSCQRKICSKTALFCAEPPCADGAERCDHRASHQPAAECANELPRSGCVQPVPDLRCSGAAVTSVAADRISANRPPAESQSCSKFGVDTTLAGGEEEIFVTLMRAFRRTVMTNGENDGQLNKELRWEYGLKFFAGQADYAGLYRQMQLLRVDLPHYWLPASQVKRLPEDASFYRISDNLTFSALKPAADGEKGVVILRVVNLSAQHVTGWVEFGSALMRASWCRLDETVVAEAVCSERKIAIAAAPWQMITLKITLKNQTRC